MLDETGLGHVQVFASGGLDEFEIEALLSAGALIDGFGVGTKVGVSADAPWTDCAYKLVEYNGRPTLKLSSKKQTLPGRKQVYGSRDGDGAYLRDVISLAEEGAPERGAEPLLRQVMINGRRAEPPHSLEGTMERFAEEFCRLPDQHKALRSPALYPVSTSERLESLRKAVSRQVGERERAAMR
jgi:nicotinate phosphoribosyltransferase